MTAANDPLSYGNLVVEMGFCTNDQVEEALAAVNGSNGATPPLLGEALVELGYLTKHQSEWVSVCQQSQRNPTPNEHRMHAFVQQQHLGLVDDLHDIAKDVQAMAAKINEKG